MRKKQFATILLVIIALMIPLTGKAQWSEAFNYKGSWSQWSKAYGSISHYDDESGIILKSPGGLTYFSFQIDHYVPPTKKELKEHLKSGEWFTYTGIVEYSVNDQYPTAEALAKASTFVIPDPRKDLTPTVLRRTSCNISIAPYKKLPACYNIWFDGIGVGIDIQGLTFKGQKKRTHRGRVAANIVQSILLFPIGIGSWWWNPVKRYDER